MEKRLRITLLVENSVHRPNLAAQHGLSLHLRFNQHNILFDTGQTDLALTNARTLGIELDRIEAIILSHGHYDHTGGLAAVLEAAPRARVFLHPAAFQDKYVRYPNTPPRYMGMSDRSRQAVRLSAGGFVETPGRTKIVEGMFVTGEIPRTTACEDTGGPFFLDADGTRPDPLADDQALIIDLGRSVVLVLGCAHAGVVNTLDHVGHLTGGKPVSAVIGGLHLGSAGEERIQQTISRLQSARLDCLVPVHCTGWPATARLWQAFPGIFHRAGVGTVFEF